MKKVRTAVVGVGALGRHHLRWLSQLTQSDLVGCFDTDAAKAAKYADEYNVRAFKSLDDLIGCVDAASIVVPTSEHYSVASKLIKAGIHCLIEKPITADSAHAGELHQLANTHRVKVTVGQIERFNPAVLALEDEHIKPSFIEAHRLAVFDPRGTDVAVVLDLMIHDIDLALKFIKSEVVDIQASAVAVISDKADIANARLTFANGAVANLTASRISLHAMRKLRIFQRSGYYSLDLATKQADLYLLVTDNSPGEGMRVPLGKSGRDLLYRKKTDTGQDMLAAELTAFLEAVIHDRPVAVTVIEASEALRLALEIDRIGTASIARMMEA